MRPSMRVLSFVAVLFTVACDSDVNVDKLAVGTEVAVTRDDGGVVQGKLVERDASVVKLDAGRRVREVPRDQIDTVQIVKAGAAPELPAKARFTEHTVPAGHTMAITLATGVSSATSRPNEAVEGRLRQGVTIDGVSVIPAGSTVRGIVTAATPSGKVKGRAALSLVFQSLTIPAHEQAYAIRAGWSMQARGNRGDDAAKIAVPAVGGAVIGGILGGKKGAVIGGVVGGGAGTAVVLSTAGDEVRLPAGALLSVDLDAPVEIRVPIRKESSPGEW